MYSSDRMKTLIRMFKDYDKIIVFRDCQMNYFYIYLRRKRSFWFSSVILLNALPKSLHDQPLLDYFWDINIDWERDCKKRQLCKADWKSRAITNNLNVELSFLAASQIYSACQERSFRRRLVYTKSINIDVVSIILTWPR